jgi:uncharacterized protein (TIGR02217 family)
MSNSVFPSLPGMAWDMVRTPVWQTRRQQSVSGKVTTIADWQYPLRKYQLTYDFLRSNPSYGELQQMVGFFNSLSGGFDTFLFSDPEDNSVTGQPIGTTDGVNGAFQLVRSYGGFTEPVYNAAAVSAVTLNGSPFYAYTLEASGMLGLGEVQPAGQAIAASFTYYWRCRFANDTIDFNNFMQQLHEVKQLNFETVK